MNGTVLHKVASMGQSIWLDTISKQLLLSNGLSEWIEKGVRGVTTNPAIFEQAIARSSDYDNEIRTLAEQGKSTDEIYEILTLQEVSAAADILKPVYESTNGLDGYVSLEVNPFLAADRDSTVEEAERLFKALARPNVMIKIPATPEGIAAIERCVARGININATLIFSVEQYSKVAEAYVNGLKERFAQGKPLKVASVASVFISRIDSALDPLLQQKEEALKGHIAIANARLTYQRFKEIFSAQAPDWKQLSEAGAWVQRPLWASTGTKDPAYSDVLYLDTLIGGQTVNTVPPKTLEAFLDHGKAVLTLEPAGSSFEKCQRLERLGIDIGRVCNKLMQDGVESFNTAFASLMKSIEQKASSQKN